MVRSVRFRRILRKEVRAAQAIRQRRRPKISRCSRRAALISCNTCLSWTTTSPPLPKRTTGVGGLRLPLDALARTHLGSGSMPEQSPPSLRNRVRHEAALALPVLNETADPYHPPNRSNPIPTRLSTDGTPQNFTPSTTEENRHQPSYYGRGILKELPFVLMAPSAILACNRCSSRELAPLAQRIPGVHHLSHGDSRNMITLRWTTKTYNRPTRSTTG